MLSTTKPAPSPHRPSIHIPGISPSNIFDLYSDSRNHGFQGPSRTVRLPKVTLGGVGALAKSEDGTRCVVAGQESLRILRVSESSEGNPPQDHKFAVGVGGHRIDAGRNLWTGSGLKIDSASTDVAWGHGVYNNKILTSARNGELIMWDLNKSGSKYERKSKDHYRSIHKIAYSHLVPYYCVTVSADENIRTWDLRAMSRSINRIRHRTSVRTVVLSPSTARPLEAIVGLDNGSIFRWDLTKGQLGQLDHLPVAHAGPVLSLDWCMPTTLSNDNSSFSSGPIASEAPSGSTTGTSAPMEIDPGSGWLVSGGMDRYVKVWDLTECYETGHIPHKPTYTLSTSSPVRRVLWRPSYECEVAIASNADSANAEGSQDKADEIEIWDVRRGYIAKWQLQGTTVDGGATDIAFRDSHAIWAHHSSGTFSQLDVRHSIRPLDAIPRIAVDWQAAGAMTFVADRQTKWEVPYDDIEPVKRPAAQERGSKIKALGDLPYFPATQSVGAFITDDILEDTDAFVRLAKSYIISGTDRISICERNAELAFSVGKDEAAHAWLLMATLLTDLIPETPPTPPLTPRSLVTPPLSHSISAPASIPILKKKSPQAGVSSRRASSSDPAAQRQQSSPSPSRGSKYSSERTVYPPQRRNTPVSTPASSTSPSPRHKNVQLPLVASRRDSNTGLFRPRSLSIYRRPSMSSHNESPSDSVKSHLSSLRHVGEGALDDSDSSGEEVELDQEDAGPSRPSVAHNVAPATPSPLSRGSQEWSEAEADDGEDEDSPSPASTDTEGASDNSESSDRGRKSKSLRVRHPRSRSSTIASLAAASSSARHPLSKQDSYSSIRTVVAEASPQHGRDDTVQDLRSSTNIKSKLSNGSRATSRKASPVSHTRQTSQALSSEYNMTSEHAGVNTTPVSPTLGWKLRGEDVRDHEGRIRDVGWGTLRDCLEMFADTGDIQMCAYLCMVAPHELRVDARRVVRFLEAYIDVLSRLRLHTSAACIRKHAHAEDIQATTMVQTTVHLSCGRCRKPILTSESSRRPHCSSCQSTFTRCSICHLPVKTLMFQCPVCAHGGHQACYKQYYSQCPLVELPSSEPRGRASTRGSPLVTEDEVAMTLDSVSEGGSNAAIVRMAHVSGHPCAAGCGHFCWIANSVDPIVGER